MDEEIFIFSNIYSLGEMLENPIFESIVGGGCQFQLMIEGLILYDTKNVLFPPHLLEKTE